MRSYSVFKPAAYPLLLLSLFFTACGGPKVGSDEVEKEDPDVQQARQLVKRQEPDAAADLLYNVLRENPNMAYAHMQLGFVFQSKQEPVKALYHFQRYLEARPDTENAGVIREVVADELKRLARRVNVDDDPLPSAGEPAELRERLRQSQRQLARAQVELQQLNVRLDGGEEEPPAEWAREKIALLEEIQRLKADESTPGPSSETEPDPVAANKTYTVQRGENLSRISEKVYGRASEWRKIFQANRDQLPSPDKVKPGMTLKIPQ